MKRLLFALALFAFILPGNREAEAAEVSIDFFYSNLSGGSWIEAGDYGYCWQPEVAVSNTNWRPYADGYWAYTDVGWTWVSYEDFGWATYHYGRWARLRDHGWVCVPGYEWGPAWVSWRTGGDYVGWAPLPPRRRGYGGGGEIVYEGRPIGASVDIEFDIGPAYYNFVDVRYIGAPVLREHIYAPTENITYINRTVNVTNITYNNATVYNYGPDYNRLSAYSSRPIQRLTLQRDTAADFTSAAQSANLSRVQGDRLVVAAPPRLQRPVQPVAPKVVKTRVEKPDVETGWMGVTDPNAKVQLQEKMKKEDPKSVPPTQIAPKNPEALNAASVPGSLPPSGTPAVPADASTAAAGTRDLKSDGRGRGRNKDKRDDAPAIQPEQPAGSAPADGANVGAAPTVPQADAPGRGKKNKDRRERDQLQPTAPQPGAEQPSPTAPDAGAGAGASQDQPRGRGKRDREQRSNVPSDAPVQPPASAAPDAAPPQPAPGLDNVRRERGKKQRERDEAPAPQSQPATQPQDAGLSTPNLEPPRDADRGGRGRGKEKRERFEMPPRSAPAPQVAPPPEAAPREMMQERGRGRRERQEPPAQMAPPPQGGPAAGGPPIAPREGRGKPERGNKKNKDDEPKKP